MDRKFKEWLQGSNNNATWRTFRERSEKAGWYDVWVDNSIFGLGIWKKYGQDYTSGKPLTHTSVSRLVLLYYFLLVLDEGYDKQKVSKEEYKIVSKGILLK